MKNTAIIALLALFMAQAAYAADPVGLNLPTDPVTMSIAYPGATSYWDVTFSGIAPGYDVKNQKYPGWCADANHTIVPGTHTCSLYSTYDDAMPYYAQNANWDLITYMVNGYRNDVWSCATKYEIQALVWEYLGQTYPWGTPDAACMAEIKADVDAYGEGFVPSAGDIATVLCDTNDGEIVTKQLIFVEIPFPAPEIASALAAIALVSPAFGYLLIKKKK